MQYLKLCLLAFLIPFAFAQEEDKPTPYGTIYATAGIGAALNLFSAVDASGKPYLFTDQNEILGISREGKIEKTLKVTNTPKGNASKFIILKSGDLFYVKSTMERFFDTLEIIDSKGAVKKTLGRYNTASSSLPIELKDGNIAIGFDELFLIVTPELKESFKVKTRSYTHTISQMEDGTIIFQDSHYLYFVDKDKKVTEVKFGVEENPISINVVTRNGTVIVERHDKEVKHFDRKGKEILSYKNEDGCDSVAVELPNDTIAIKCGDGYIHFKDMQGKILHSHFHDSKMAVGPFYIGKNVLVYANSKQLIFLDLKGKEIGSQELSRKPFAKVNVNNLGNNQFMIFVDLESKVIFFKH